MASADYTNCSRSAEWIHHQLGDRRQLRVLRENLGSLGRDSGGFLFRPPLKDASILVRATNGLDPTERMLQRTLDLLKLRYRRVLFLLLAYTMDRRLDLIQIGIRR